MITLTLYGLLPIVRNSIVGLRGVDPALVDAATGIGMSRTARLRRVELPLAWPPILTGIRVSTRVLMDNVQELLEADRLTAMEHQHELEELRGRQTEQELEGGGGGA